MSFVKRHPIITFFVLTFVLSWWTWPLYAVGLSPSPVFSGPLLAALIVIPLTQGWAGLRELGLRIIRWRVGWRWYAVALGIPLAVAAAAVALSGALGASWSFAGLPALSALVMVFAIRLFDPLGAPVGEEPGWPLAAGRYRNPRGAGNPLAYTSRFRSRGGLSPPDRPSCDVRGDILLHMALQPHRRQRAHDHGGTRRPGSRQHVSRGWVRRGYGAAEHRVARYCRVVRPGNRVGRLRPEGLAQSCGCRDDDATTTGDAAQRSSTGGAIALSSLGLERSPPWEESRHEASGSSLASFTEPRRRGVLGT